MTFTYRYFERPHDFSTYQQVAKQCDVCSCERPGYAAPFYGLREIAFVCEECLASGELQNLDTSTNEGDIATLQEQLHVLYPQLSDAERDQLAQERTAELHYRTPHLVTWQDFFWPVHCCDYCRFVKEVGKPELNSLSPDADGVALLVEHCHDIGDREHAQEVWDSIRPDVPTNGANAYSVGVYLFRCLVCEKPVLLWDCE